MAAQPDSITVMVNLDVAAARTQVKRVIREANEANRLLAELEEKLDAFAAKLRTFGIDLEVGDD